MIICELKERIYGGDCEQCGERVYCILKELLEKVNHLETTIEELKEEKVHAHLI